MHDARVYVLQNKVLALITPGFPTIYRPRTKTNIIGRQLTATILQLPQKATLHQIPKGHVPHTVWFLKLLTAGAPRRSCILRAAHIPAIAYPLTRPPIRTILGLSQVRPRKEAPETIQVNQDPMFLSAGHYSPEKEPH